MYESTLPEVSVRCLSEGAEPPLWSAAVRAPLPERLLEAPQKAGCFPSKPTPPLSLSKSASSSPKHWPWPFSKSMHSERGKPVPLVLIPKILPQAARARKRGLLRLGLCFPHNCKPKTCSLQKTKEYIHQDK